ncbi:endonuclease/exonuclease/phosphatase family member [Naegleria gruberi]|uniref:Endonuclease/exonuclease/phosphatase family member n=1 Tax=Naegleria gruberi TaxID=5762 RepID=D2VNC2_NAEGR|nr:endonuclease/exonuclease/phosphatase family member [Naegleria gruberi]EFC41630.1 endonuclease/exonuclease/phosphatase family member [Naegleria gruberi]|eukprot:XP_002674374.1 endonuclease/exonuclease/phosphatase family member [Naegleria gruberi strain NEG-M]
MSQQANNKFYSVKSEQVYTTNRIKRFERTLTEPNQFSVYSQNLLAGYWTDLDRYYFVEEPKEEHYEWSGRVKKLLRDFTIHQPDILCLQEVELACFEKDVLEPLQKVDESYRGVAQKKLGDFPVGVGCIFKESVFELVEVFERSSVIILVLKFKANDTLIYVSSCHLMGDPRKPQTRINQLKSYFKHLKNYQKGKDHPVIVAGDFNTEPNSATYDYVVNGFLKGKSEENDVIATDTDIKHTFKLKSAYKEINGKEPEMTLRTINSSLTCDYLFYTNESLKLNNVMSLYENGDKTHMERLGLPNSKYGSDHLGLQAHFTITKQ